METRIKKATAPISTILSLMVCFTSITGCTNGSNNTAYNNQTTTKAVTTTVAATTSAATTKETVATKETYHISESTAISIAKALVEKHYTDHPLVEPVTDKVYFGDVKCESDISNKDYRYGTVVVSGHYYEKDKYGNSKGKRNFTKWVEIDKKTQKAMFK